MRVNGWWRLPSANTPPFELPFIVQGRWDDPIMLPDAQALIRRSGAAAPLLDAMRDRRTRDAVRNAIQQLSRDGAVELPAPQSETAIPEGPALASEPPAPAAAPSAVPAAPAATEAAPTR